MLSDTSSRAAVVQQEIFRRMTTKERLHLALEMSESMRSLALASLRNRRPDLDHIGLSREFLRLMHGFVPFGL
jgi:thymidine phosphorylase